MSDKEFKNPLVNVKTIKNYHKHSYDMSEKEFIGCNRTMSIRAAIIKEAEKRLLEEEPDAPIEKVGALRGLIFYPGAVKLYTNVECSAFVKAYGKRRA